MKVSNVSSRKRKQKTANGFHNPANVKKWVIGIRNC
jgi:hypothetical protein